MKLLAWKNFPSQEVWFLKTRTLKICVFKNTFFRTGNQWRTEKGSYAWAPLRKMVILLSKTLESIIYLIFRSMEKLLKNDHYHHALPYNILLQRSF